MRNGTGLDFLRVRGVAAGRLDGRRREREEEEEEAWPPGRRIGQLRRWERLRMEDGGETSSGDYRARPVHTSFFCSGRLQQIFFLPRTSATSYAQAAVPGSGPFVSAVS